MNATRARPSALWIYEKSRDIRRKDCHERINARQPMRLHRGLYESGCEVLSAYPGTPSTEIAEYAAMYDDIYCEWAPNEKVALEVAFGASLAGRRSFCCHETRRSQRRGRSVVHHVLYRCRRRTCHRSCGRSRACIPSQNEQDSRHYAVAAKLPMLEPADSAEALAFVRRGLCAVGAI